MPRSALPTVIPIGTCGATAAETINSGVGEHGVGVVVEPSQIRCYRGNTSSAGTQSARNLEGNVLSHKAEAATQTAAQVASMSVPNGFNNAVTASDALLERILSSLDEDKAEDVVAIDLAGKSEMADHMVVCTGRSSRQVSSISEKLVERLKADLGVNSKIEGKNAGDWVLIDAGDVIVHVFRPEVREFYQIEKMWMPNTSAGKATPTP